MKDRVAIRGRGAYPGVAQGEAVVCRDSIAGWGPVLELKTGVITEPGNPAEGLTIRGKVLILNGSRGSTGFATQFHKAKVAGVGPLALVIPRIDSRTGVTCAILQVPAVTDLEEDVFAIVSQGDWIVVDGDKGQIEIFAKRARTNLDRDIAEESDISPS
jgi:predicted aconitase with swiveling domain